MKHNVIPRNFKAIIANCLVNSSAGKPTKWIITHDGYYRGYNTSDGKFYQMFVSHLRNPAFFEIVEIIK